MVHSPRMIVDTGDFGSFALYCNQDRIGRRDGNEADYFSAGD
jgi:hypothetical protein